MAQGAVSSGNVRRLSSIKLTIAGEDVVFAFGRQVHRSAVTVLPAADDIGDLGQQRVRVAELKDVDHQDRVVVSGETSVRQAAGRQDSWATYTRC